MDTPKLKMCLPLNMAGQKSYVFVINLLLTISREKFMWETYLSVTTKSFYESLFTDPAKNSC